MKVLIPMGGHGQRFLDAGYLLPKPLIEIDGMPVIEHIVQRFSPSDEFVFGVLEEHLQSTPLEAVLRRIAPRAKIMPVSYSSLGPVGTLLQMLQAVDNNEPVLINYCDFSWVWDYDDFQKCLDKTACDGAVVCYRGFHPHLLGPNLYATVRANGLWLEEIREKHSWHANKHEDWTSSGTYYFRKGRYLKKYFRAIEKHKEQRIRGEIYVSQVFQLMKEDGLKIYIYEIPFMLQWGTPEDLEDYLYWSCYFRKKKFYPQKQNRAPQHDMSVMMLMAGAGERFAQAGYKLPKPFIPVDGKPMVLQAVQSLPPATSYVFVTRQGLENPEAEEIIKQHLPQAIFLRLKALSEGQASSAFHAQNEINPDRALLIGACDHGILYNPEVFARKTAQGGADALIFTVRGYPQTRFQPQMFSWVEVADGDLAKKVLVKTTPAGDVRKHHLVLGDFWLRRARDFFSHAARMLSARDRHHQEFYIDQCMNYLIQAGLRVEVFEVDGYAAWGTPDELKTYTYWERFFRQASFHPYQNQPAGP